MTEYRGAGGQKEELPLGQQRKVRGGGAFSGGLGGSDAGGVNADYSLGNISFLDTFSHNSQVVDIFVLIPTLQIRKLLLNKGV